MAFLPLPVNPGTRLPDWPRVKVLLDEVAKLVQFGVINAASVVREGGAAAAVARMCFGNHIGFAFNRNVDRATLFAPLAGSLVVELKEGDMCLEGLEYSLIGTTMEEEAVVIDGQELPLEDLIDIWTAPLEPVFPNKADEEPEMTPAVPLYVQRSGLAPAIKAARPRVFIPVFPGTNCEYDTARAFEQAGAQPDVLVVKNLSPAAIEETIDRMEDAIRQAQIVMLPGGFSGGDEPDGSGKFIATTFRNPRVAEAVTELLEQPGRPDAGHLQRLPGADQAGTGALLARIRELRDSDPTLTFNTLGRHVSRMVYTRVTSVKSPWLSGCAGGRHPLRAGIPRGGAVRGGRGHAASSWRPTGRSPPSMWIPEGQPIGGHSVEPQRLGLRGGRHHLPGRPGTGQDGPQRAQRGRPVQERSRREGSTDFHQRRPVFCLSRRAYTSKASAAIGCGGLAAFQVSGRALVYTLSGVALVCRVSLRKP